MTQSKPTIAVIGGTGNLGAALARRWAKAGFRVVIGSRDAERAATVAGEMVEQGWWLSGAANRDAAADGDVVVVAVPFASHEAIYREIAPVTGGKIVVDATVPLVPPKVARVQLPAEGCAALRARGMLGDDTELVSAFHNVAAHKLATDEDVGCDVLIFGDSKAARIRVADLVSALGLRGIHGGPLANSAAAEALTSVLIFINRAHGADGAGIRITGELKPILDA